MWIKTKISGSTLMEVIVALVLLSIITTAIFTVMVKAGNYHTNRRDMMIENHLQQLLEQIKTREDVPQIIEHELYTVQIENKAFSGFEKCRRIHFTVRSRNEKVIEELTAIIVLEPRSRQDLKTYEYELLH